MGLTSGSTLVGPLMLGEQGFELRVIVFAMFFILLYYCMHLILKGYH